MTVASVKQMNCRYEYKCQTCKHQNGEITLHILEPGSDVPSLFMYSNLYFFLNPETEAMSAIRSCCNITWTNSNHKIHFFCTYFYIFKQFISSQAGNAFISPLEEKKTTTKKPLSKWCVFINFLIISLPCYFPTLIHRCFES